jgi:hypothetical protein
MDFYLKMLDFLATEVVQVLYETEYQLESYLLRRVLQERTNSHVLSVFKVAMNKLEGTSRYLDVMDSIAELIESEPNPSTQLALVQCLADFIDLDRLYMCGESELLASSILSLYHHKFDLGLMEDLQDDNPQYLSRFTAYERLVQKSV